MSSPEGIFHAFVRDIENGTLSSQRYVISFVSRDSADLWWRALQETRAQAQIQRKEDWGMKRISPQYYVFEGSARVLWKVLSTPVHKFVLDYTLIEGDSAVSHLLQLPPPSRTDYQNGKSYCIRSRRRPEIYLAAIQSGSQPLRLGYMHHNNDYPMRFIIELRTPWPFPFSEADEQILVPSDLVALRPITTERGAGSERLMASAVRKVTGSASVPQESKVFEFAFGYLTTRKGFLLERGSANRIIFDDRGEVGEQWELVE